MQKLIEYFHYDCITDIREHITWMRDVHDERWAYEGLIYDEMYLSWQYYNYLNNTGKGKAARAALYASGLVFNKEIDNWIDPTTYLDGELPGIKKYKSLLEEFIQQQSTSVECYSYIKEAEKFLKSSVGICTAVEKGQIIKQLEEAPDIKTCKSIFNNFAAVKCNFKDEEEKFVLVGEKPVFIETMGYVDTTFKITNMGVDALCALADISANLETYKIYHEFLEEIYKADDLPWELKVAGYQLDEELRQAYYTPIKNVLDEMRDTCLKEFFDAKKMIEIVVAKEYLNSVNFTAFCINQFVDAGKLVVNSCHTEGYVFLAMHYKNKLEKCKAQFLLNKTEENAWAFYEAYVMLWKLRIVGENKFLKMSKVEGGTAVDNLTEIIGGSTLGDIISDLNGYADKEVAVNTNLERLKSFAFKYSIKDADLSDEYEYLKKIIIECPVIIEILSNAGTRICLLNDKEENIIINEYGKFMSFYRATTGDYVKIAYLYDDLTYTVRILGKEEGKVNYTIGTTDDHKTLTQHGFIDIPIYTNGIIQISTDTDNFTIDENGDGTIDIIATQGDKNRIFVQFDYQNGEDIIFAYTDINGNVAIPKEPMRKGYIFSGWYTELNGAGSIFSVEDSVKKVLLCMHIG